MTPLVTFIVPCYKLAHLLRECVDSILAQTYTDFEVLIMDDCSPDNTPEVAQSFHDPRVRHIRNEPNLGHLRNYNKGIELARGKYIWLISADDRLRRNYVLEKYVKLLETNQKIGYVFCPGMNLVNEQEKGILEWSKWNSDDAVAPGIDVLRKLLERNFIVACSGLARKECYETVSYFPLDLPYAGDWYLWSLFALYYDVGYFAEPMVSYRLHELAITNRITRTKRLNDNLLVLWRILAELRKNGFHSLAEDCLRNLAQQYAYYVAAEKFGTSQDQMTTQEWEDSMMQHATVRDAALIRACVYARLADGCCKRGQYQEALELCHQSARNGGWGRSLWIKKTLLALGPVGISLLRNLFLLRNTFRFQSQPVD